VRIGVGVLSRIYQDERACETRMISYSSMLGQQCAIGCHCALSKLLSGDSSSRAICVGLESYLQSAAE
jgi:hypothetical protein